jgi:hypothetical protein
MVTTAYAELLESLPLVLGEPFRQRILRLLRFRSARLVLLGFLIAGELASSESVEQQSDATSGTGGTPTGAGASVADVDITTKSRIVLDLHVQRAEKSKNDAPGAFLVPNVAAEAFLCATHNLPDYRLTHDKHSG